MGPSLVHTISLVTSLVVLGVSAGTDLRDRRIPNKLVGVTAAIGLTRGLISAPEVVWRSILIAVVVFCALGFLSQHRIVGGGDVKLISAVTLLVPPDHVGLLLVEIAIAGGVLSCLYLLGQHIFKNAQAHRPSATKASSRPSHLSVAVKNELTRIATGKSLPYALAVFGGVGFYTARGLVRCSYAISCLQ